MTKTQVQTNIDGSHATITFVTEEGLNVLSTDGLYALGAAIADLEGVESITIAHVAEAIQYRTLDRKFA